METGILRYRGYPSKPREKSTYLETRICSVWRTAYSSQLKDWTTTSRTTLSSRKIKKFWTAFITRHPMGMISPRLRTFHFLSRAKDIFSADPQEQTYRCRKFDYRGVLLSHTWHAVRLSGNDSLSGQLSQHALSHHGTKFGQSDARTRPRVLFILHADHEQNCSATPSAASAAPLDPYSATAAAILPLRPLRRPMKSAPRRGRLRVRDRLFNADGVSIRTNTHLRIRARHVEGGRGALLIESCACGGTYLLDVARIGATALLRLHGLYTFRVKSDKDVGVWRRAPLSFSGDRSRKPRRRGAHLRDRRIG